MNITHAIGKVIDQPVDVVVNSANGRLIPGTGTAGYIREASGCLSGWEEQQLLDEVRQSAYSFIQEYAEVIPRHKDEYGWCPSNILRECIRVLIEHGGQPIPIGSAVMTSSGDLARQPGKPKFVIHAVGMTYEKDEQGIWQKVAATTESVKQAVTSALKLADSHGFHSIALPVMCSRAGGLSVESSLRAIHEGIRRSVSLDTLNSIVIVGDTDISAEYIGFHYSD